jgi:tRNA U34 2-thiouridine synthase MnmA/TrmU
MPDTADRLISYFTAGEKVMAGIAGDPYSAVAAWAAKEAGVLAEGVTLLLCGETAELRAAEDAANRLGIDWRVADYRGFFGEDVLSAHISALKGGRASSPCAFCANRGRIPYLFRELARTGAQKFVTGDLARIAPWKDGFAVYKAGSGRDTSRNLALADPFFLSYMSAPLGEIESSDEILKLAGRLGIDTEGQRVRPCFPVIDGIPRTDMPGKKELYGRKLKLTDTVFRKDEPPISKVTVALAGRYKHTPALLEIFFGNTAALLTDKPVLSSPGEVAAVYSGKRLVGGGIVRL